jgi:mono/diheme cytochrome c family protein
MKASKPLNISYFLPENFQLSWMRWAFGFFFIASLLGLLMRAFTVMDVPLVDYRNILHAHSHVALLGWGFMMLMAGIVFSLFKPEDQVKEFGGLFLLAIISVLGMLVSFPVQGYGMVSISFSILQILVTYGFAYKILRHVRLLEKTIGVRLIRLAISFLLISTLGLWALGPIMSQLGRMHELYFMSIQWFLHFQLNGWFVLGVLGLVVLHVEKQGHTLGVAPWKLHLLGLSVVLTFALAVTWAEPSLWAFRVNGLAVSLQLLAYVWIISPLFKELKKMSFPMTSSWLLRSALLSLLVKGLLQALLVLPQIAVMSYTIRMYVIGFLHLVLLGIMSFGLGSLAVAKGWIPDTKFAQFGWLSLFTGFVFSEALLFLQGTLIWGNLGFLAQYHLWLFIASSFLPIGLGILLISLITTNQTHLINQKINQLTRSKNQTMKNSFIMSLGILGILMTSCGGGSSSDSSNSAADQSAVEEVKPADPKGVGAIQDVNLGAGVDPALAETGQAIVDMKCTACHQLNDKRLVGPGFQGVTNRRRPEWIMNMITNVDVMLDQDPVAQKLLEECLTRMPNQNITMDDARGILEFFRQNDETKAGERDTASK